MNFQVDWVEATDVYQQHLFLLKNGFNLEKEPHESYLADCCFWIVHAREKCFFTLIFNNFMKMSFDNE